MVNERIPVIPENTPEPPEDYYEQSANLLLGLAATGEDEHSAPVYCTIEWGEGRQITDVTLATVSPTGAGRQELWGQFHQAQFKVNQWGPDGAEKGHRFIWCTTDPRNLGDPVLLDEDRLATEHGFARLSDRHLVGTLSLRAKTLDDYSNLTAIMEQHGVAGTPELERNLRRLLGGIVQRAQEIPESIDKMLELAEKYQHVSVIISPLIQGRLVSILLRGISGAPVGDKGSRIGTPDIAAATLKEALERGIIPHEHRTLDRILAAPAVYNYPFATELLHSHLESSRHTSAHRIFGNNRLDFVRTYIARIVGVSSEDADVTQYLSTSKLDYEPGRGTFKQEQALRRLVNTLASFVYGGELSDETPHVTSSRTVPAAYDYILERMNVVPGSIAADEELRRKSIEAVEMLLLPVIQQAAGKRAVEHEVFLEPEEGEE